MGLTNQSSGHGAVIIQAKHYSLWRGIKTPVPGCEAVEVNNPSTGERVTKYGYKYNNLTAFAVKLEWYDTGTKHETQYIGFKLHMVDVSGEKFILDMPLEGPVLRKFMRIAPNLDFSKEISLTVFKGKGEGPVAPTAIWFQQEGQTVMQAYTKDNPGGLPAAKQNRTGKWNFDDQNDWLIDKMNTETAPAVIEAANARGYNPDASQHQHASRVEEALTGHNPQPARHAAPVSAPRGWNGETPRDEIGDDDVPF